MADGNLARSEGRSVELTSIEISVEDPMSKTSYYSEEVQPFLEIIPQSDDIGDDHSAPGGSGTNPETNAVVAKILTADASGDDVEVLLIIEEYELARLRRLTLIQELMNTRQLPSQRQIELPPQIPQLLHYAAENGITDLLKILLENPEIDVNVQERGLTALILACWKGHTEIVQELLLKGADVHIYTRDGFTCLHMAAFCGHIKVVNLLLHGKVERVFGEKCDLLHMAAFCRDVEMVNCFLKSENYNESNIPHFRKSTTKCCWAKRCWALIERESKIEMFTALHMAAGGSHDEDAVDIVSSILEALIVSVVEFYYATDEIQKGVSVPTFLFAGIVKHQLWCEFLLQIRKALHEGDGEIIQEKVLQDLATYGNLEGFALQEELGNRYEVLVRAFVELVSYSHAKDRIDRTVLHHAALGNRCRLVKFLIWGLQFGAVTNVNVADVDGHTALHLASVKGCERAVKELMSCNTTAPEERGHYKMELDDQFYGTSYLKPNLATLSPSGRSVSIVTTINREAETSAEDPEEKDDRHGRSLLFNEEVKAFLYYKIGKSSCVEVVDLDLEELELEESHDSRRRRPFPNGWSFLSEERKKVFYYYRIGESPFSVQQKELAWTGDCIWFEKRTGYTPLHYAVEQDLEAVVGLLVMHPDTDLFRCASDGLSPWTIAQRRKLAKHSLIGYPGPIEIGPAGSEESKSTGFWFNDPFEISLKNYVGWRKFHQQKLLKRAVELALAAENNPDSKGLLVILEGGILETFKSYLKHDTRYFIEGSSEREFTSDVTLLQAAAYYGLGEEIEEMLKLNRYREHVNDREDFTNRGQTAMHFATDGGVDAVAALLKEKALLLITQRSTQSLTPLDFIEEKIDRLVTSSKSGKDKGLSSQIYSILNPPFEEGKQFYTQRLKMLQESERLLVGSPLLIEKLYRDRQVFVDAANAILVGAALIASVTFGGFLQPPLGYVPFSSTPQSFAAVEQHISVRVFWAFNSLSFFLAIATVVAGGGAVLPTSRKSIEQEVRLVRKWLSLTSALLALSIFCVLGAFTSAGFASLPTAFKYKVNILATATLGLTLCFTVLFAFVHRLYLSFNTSSPVRIFIDENIQSLHLLWGYTKVTLFVVGMPIGEWNRYYQEYSQHTSDLGHQLGKI